LKRAIEVGIERRVFGFYSDRAVTYNGLRRGNYVRKKTILRFYPTPGQLRILNRADQPVVPSNAVPYEHMIKGYYSGVDASWMMPTEYEGYKLPPIAVFSRDSKVGAKFGADNLYVAESPGNVLGYENQGLVQFIRFLGGSDGYPVESCSRFLYWYVRRRRRCMSSAH